MKGRLTVDGNAIQVIRPSSAGRGLLRNGFALLGLALAVLALTGCGGQYKTLHDAWEQAATPALFEKPDQAGLLPAGAAVPTAEPARPAGPDLESGPAPDPQAQDPFMAADPERVQKLQPAAHDETAATRALADGFTLADFLILAQLRNPGLREAEAGYRSMLARYEQAAALSDLLDRYAAFTQGLDPGVGNMAGRTPLAMQYPFPGPAALRGGIAHQDALAAFERLRIARRAVITSANKAFFELQYAYKAHELAKQSLALLTNLKDTLTARYEVGQAELQQLVRVNQEYSRTAEQVPIQLAMRNSRQEPLRALLALPAKVAIGRPADTGPEPKVPDLDTTVAQAIDQRQELRELRIELKRAELLIELAETALYPGFSLNLSLPDRNEIMQMPEEGERPDAYATATMAAAGAGQPLGQTYGIESAYLAEARQNLLARRAQLRAAEADTMAAVHAAWFNLDKASREERVARERIVPLAATDLDTITAAYAAGTLAFSEVIEAANRWFDTRLAWERLRADLGIAQAELVEAVGGPIKP